MTDTGQWNCWSVARAGAGMGELKHPSWEDKLVCRQQFAVLKCVTRALQSAMNSFLLFPVSYPALAIQIRYLLFKNIPPKLHLSPCFSPTWLKCFVRWLGDQCLNHSSACRRSSRYWTYGTVNYRLGILDMLKEKMWFYCCLRDGRIKIEE